LVKKGFVGVGWVVLGGVEITVQQLFMGGKGCDAVDAEQVVETLDSVNV
jgi:hypothetical protein